MTASEFIQYVEVKLNRIDSSSYEDIRPEEVIFFANDALKSLILAFDIGAYSRTLDVAAIKVYLGALQVYGNTEVPISSNRFALLDKVLKFKDVVAQVKVPDADNPTETGWMPTRWLDNNQNTTREDNPFLKSFADKPIFRLITKESDDAKIIQFETNGFEVTSIRYDYLKYPTEITEGSVLSYPFMDELENHTVTLILENLEARRLQTQPSVSRS